MSEDFTPFMKDEIDKVRDSLDKSFKITRQLISNLPNNNEIRTTAILVGAGFELIFDVILDFRFRTDRFSKDFMINKKREIIASEGILNEIYASDIKAIIDIRNHCGHEIDVDEKLIRGWLHGTQTYQRNKELMDGKSLGEELRQVSTLILNTFWQQFKIYAVNHLNKVDGWK